MFNISLNALCQLLKEEDLLTEAYLQGHESKLIKGVSTDTRTLQPHNLFIALKGEKFDSHEFLQEATAQGASAVLVNQRVNCDLPQLVVTDTIAALGTLSHYWRQHFSLPIIAVTGSNGKTTLKNMLAAILTAAAQGDANAVLATKGNLNNHLGLPLNLLRLADTHRYAVLEMGMNHFGEIAYLTRLTEPNVAVITNAAEAHLAGVESVAGVAKAKGEIFQGLNAKGTAVLNYDDAHFNYWQSLLQGQRFISFGASANADVHAELRHDGDITIHTPNGTMLVQLPLLGMHNALNALAATAAALALNIDLPTIKSGLEHVLPATGRMRLFKLPNNVRVIDDTYNANPFSLRAAVKTLANFSGPKMVVLGDMRELGPDAENLHRTAGREIAAVGIEHLFTLGELSAAASAGFGPSSQHFTEHNALIAALKPWINQEITILIKGSRSMRMETVVHALVPTHQLAPAG